MGAVSSADIPPHVFAMRTVKKPSRGHSCSENASLFSAPDNRSNDCITLKKKNETRNFTTQKSDIPSRKQSSSHRTSSANTIPPISGTEDSTSNPCQAPDTSSMVVNAGGVTLCLIPLSRRYFNDDYKELKDFTAQIMFSETSSMPCSAPTRVFHDPSTMNLLHGSPVCWMHPLQSSVGKSNAPVMLSNYSSFGGLPPRAFPSVASGQTGGIAGRRVSSTLRNMPSYSVSSASSPYQHSSITGGAVPTQFSYFPSPSLISPFPMIPPSTPRNSQTGVPANLLQEMAAHWNKDMETYLSLVDVTLAHWFKQLFEQFLEIEKTSQMIQEERSRRVSVLKKERADAEAKRKRTACSHHPGDVTEEEQECTQSRANTCDNKKRTRRHSTNSILDCFLYRCPLACAVCINEESTEDSKPKRRRRRGRKSSKQAGQALGSGRFTFPTEPSSGEEPKGKKAIKPCTMRCIGYVNCNIGPLCMPLPPASVLQEASDCPAGSVPLPTHVERTTTTHPHLGTPLVESTGIPFSGISSPPSAVPSHGLSSLPIGNLMHHHASPLLFPSLSLSMGASDEMQRRLLSGNAPPHGVPAGKHMTHDSEPMRGAGPTTFAPQDPSFHFSAPFHQAYFSPHLSHSGHIVSYGSYGNIRGGEQDSTHPTSKPVLMSKVDTRNGVDMYLDIHLLDEEEHGYLLESIIALSSVMYSSHFRHCSMTYSYPDNPHLKPLFYHYMNLMNLHIVIHKGRYYLLKAIRDLLVEFGNIPTTFFGGAEETTAAREGAPKTSTTGSPKPHKRSDHEGDNTEERSSAKDLRWSKDTHTCSTQHAGISGNRHMYTQNVLSSNLMKAKNDTEPHSPLRDDNPIDDTVLFHKNSSHLPQVPSVASPSHVFPTKRYLPTTTKNLDTNAIFLPSSKNTTTDPPRSASAVFNGDDSDFYSRKRKQPLSTMEEEFDVPSIDIKDRVFSTDVCFKSNERDSALEIVIEGGVVAEFCNHLSKRAIIETATQQYVQYSTQLLLSEKEKLYKKILQNPSEEDENVALQNRFAPAWKVLRWLEMCIEELETQQEQNQQEQEALSKQTTQVLPSLATGPSSQERRILPSVVVGPAGSHTMQPSSFPDSFPHSPPSVPRRLSFPPPEPSLTREWAEKASMKKGTIGIAMRDNVGPPSSEGLTSYGESTPCTCLFNLFSSHGDYSSAGLSTNPVDENLEGVLDGSHTWQVLHSVRQPESGRMRSHSFHPLRYLPTSSPSGCHLFFTTRSAGSTTATSHAASHVSNPSCFTHALQNTPEEWFHGSSDGQTRRGQSAAEYSEKWGTQGHPGRGSPIRLTDSAWLTRVLADGTSIGNGNDNSARHYLPFPRATGGSTAGPVIHPCFGNPRKAVPPPSLAPPHALPMRSLPPPTALTCTPAHPLPPSLPPRPVSPPSLYFTSPSPMNLPHAGTCPSKIPEDLPGAQVLQWKGEPALSCMKESMPLKDPSKGFATLLPSVQEGNFSRLADNASYYQRMQGDALESLCEKCSPDECETKCWTYQSLPSGPPHAFTLPANPTSVHDVDSHAKPGEFSVLRKNSYGEKDLFPVDYVHRESLAATPSTVFKTARPPAPHSPPSTEENEPQKEPTPDSWRVIEECTTVDASELLDPFSLSSIIPPMTNDQQAGFSFVLPSW